METSVQTTRKLPKDASKVLTDSEDMNDIMTDRKRYKRRKRRYGRRRDSKGSEAAQDKRDTIEDKTKSTVLNSPILPLEKSKNVKDHGKEKPNNSNKDKVLGEYFTFLKDNFAYKRIGQGHFGTLLYVLKLTTSLSINAIFHFYKTLQTTEELRAVVLLEDLLQDREALSKQIEKKKLDPWESNGKSRNRDRLRDFYEECVEMSTGLESGLEQHKWFKANSK